MIGPVILECNVVWVRLFKIIEEIIKRTRHVVVLVNISCTKHFHYHGKVLLVIWSFVFKVEYESQKQHLSGVVPEGLA